MKAGKMEVQDECSDENTDLQITGKNENLRSVWKAVGTGRRIESTWDTNRERIGIDMFGFLVGLGFLTFMLWLGFNITGALLSACFWLFIEVPLAFCAWGIGLILCCTIILLPIGLWFFKTGFKLLIPGI